MTAERRRIHVVAALIRRGDEFLLDRRSDGRHRGAWEFPGGKREPGETDPQALERELLEELGVRSTIGGEVARVRHEADGVAIDLVLYEAFITGEPECREVAALGWFTLDAMGNLSMPPADRPLVEAVRAALQKGRSS
jgi:mutator protein MutT